MNKITARDLHNMVMVIWSVDGKMRNLTYNDMEDFNDFRPLENELVNIDQFKPNDQFFKYEFKNNEHDYYELLNSQYFNEGMAL